MKRTPAKPGEYSIAGDPKSRTFDEFTVALSTAISIASARPRDGEEYRHGVKHNGQVVGTVIRHADNSITAIRFDCPGGRS